MLTLILTILAICCAVVGLVVAVRLVSSSFLIASKRADRPYSITPVDEIKNSTYRKEFDIKTEYSKMSNRAGSDRSVMQKQANQVRAAKSYVSYPSAPTKHSNSSNDGLNLLETIAVAVAVTEIFSDNSSDNSSSYDNNSNDSNGSNDSSGTE
jgi:hypothetical protein